MNNKEQKNHEAWLKSMNEDVMSSEWIDIKHLISYSESHEFADFAYISISGYADTAFGIEHMPDDAQAFIILPFNNYKDISNEY